jgi:hypothetical protein
VEAVIKILEKSTEVSWGYDEDTDVRALSAREPRPAVGVDIGEDVVARYDEENKEFGWCNSDRAPCPFANRSGNLR